MSVPFLDLKAHHAPMRHEIDLAIAKVIDKGAFAGGPYVERFEREFAEYCEISHAVAVGSGTVALWLSLLALGIGPGDEVITVASTFIATGEAISFTGAHPVFVDIEAPTCTMDPAKLEQAINSRTKAILPVHLFGQTADMRSIVAVANAHGIPVIEDACQAHGARHHSRRAGTMGKAGCFSFYPGKNLGAPGEGGAVVTDDAAFAAEIRMMRDHGQTRKYFHQVPGWNGRMGGIQAAVLSVKLKFLERNNAKRRAVASFYDELLKNTKRVQIPVSLPSNEHVYHLYAIRMTNGRDEAVEFLTKSGIGCGIHYPIPLHLTEAYADLLIPAGSFPVSEQSASQFLSLPMYPELETSSILEVVETLKEFLSRKEETHSMVA
jgi:dTDP-4-amino-4,6-dideoxygalactose transaminase